jgi:putative nucleotidyltransferase with HDIG domain
MSPEKPAIRVRLTPVNPASPWPDIDLLPGDSKTVGRGTQANVIVDDPSLSRMHARLTLDADGRLHVEDLGSTNGVMVNGTQHKSTDLSADDVVAFGFVEYVVVVREGMPAHAPQTPNFADQTIMRVTVKRDAPPVVDKVVLEALLATSRELMAFEDLPGLLERVLDRLHTIVKPDRSAILLVDRTTGALTPRAVRPRGAYTSVSQFASSTLIREALASSDALIISDPMSNPRLQHAASVVQAYVRSAICVPLFGRSGAIGALYADRVGSADDFTPDLAQYAGAFASYAASALETAQLYEDREAHFRATLEAFAKAIDARDPYTAGHSERVTKYVLALARARGISETELEIIRRGGMMHDIGKVGVPDAVLRKAGPLNPEERAFIEAHPTTGFKMLQAVPFLVDALPSIRSHHERWDGQGYPDKLAGTRIHPHARLMAVADTYDAMTSARPYRGALSREEAARRIRAEVGTQFDPAAVEIFDVVEAEFHALREGTMPVAAV